MNTRSHRELDASKSWSGAALVGCLVKIVVAGVAGALIVCAAVYFFFFSTTHHESAATIIFPMHGDLTPSTARDITLYAAGLDHTAEYTVSEEGLQRFLKREFGSNFEGPDAVDRETFDNYYRDGALADWEWSEDLVSYDMWKARGTSHRLLHDTKTGRTHQASAHW